MPAKASAADFENAVKAYLGGESVESAAARFHTSQGRLGDELKARGLLRDKATRMRLNHVHRSATIVARSGLPDAEIVARYLAGESENAIAKSLGTVRSAVRLRLRLAGVPIRSNAEANRRMAAERTPEQRRLYAQAAHDAVRGKPRTLEATTKGARTRQERLTHSSPLEATLRGWLEERGIAMTPQLAEGPYNIDLGAYPVAVEVFGGAWHAHGYHLTVTAKRARYLLDRGWNLIIVWAGVRRCPLSQGAADYIAAFCERAGGDPPLRGEYRVIWGDGQEASAGSLNLDDIALIPARGAANRARA